jgi:hypothetical protein
MKPVTIALTTGDVAVIGKGLEGGEHVIIEGQNQVRPGGRVEPANASGGPAGPGRPSAGQPGGQPDRRGKRGQADAAPAAGVPDGERPSGGSANPGPHSSGPEVRPVGGQAALGVSGDKSRPRGSVTGPTAASQAPAAP